MFLSHLCNLFAIIPSRSYLTVSESSPKDSVDKVRDFATAALEFKAASNERKQQKPCMESETSALF